MEQYKSQAIICVIKVGNKKYMVQVSAYICKNELWQNRPETSKNGCPQETVGVWNRMEATAMKAKLF